jgi:hypothetical protein
MLDLGAASSNPLDGRLARFSIRLKYVFSGSFVSGLDICGYFYYLEARRSFD